VSIEYVQNMTISGAHPGFQVKGVALKKIAPSGGRREHFWGVSCEKSRFYAKKSYVNIKTISVRNKNVQTTVSQRLAYNVF
jgi:hypothetical protein